MASVADATDDASLPRSGPPLPGLARTARGGLGDPPTWATGPEALAVCLHRLNRRRVGLIAAVVGTLLVGINQGAVLASGHMTWMVWVRVLLDYLIPASVSTMGVLAGSRRSNRESRADTP
ncbi:MAG: nitrate/nitrite transporter NrtS [Acidimicrobiales bacterium]